MALASGGTAGLGPRASLIWRGGGAVPGGFSATYDNPEGPFPEWDLELNVANLGELLPNGTYTVSITGGNLDGKSQDIELTGSASDFPDAPFLPGVTFDVLQGLDSPQPFPVNF